jgi:hypothetical protein
MVSSPQNCGKWHNPSFANYLQPTKNLPISFAPFRKIEPEAKESPGNPGLSSLTAISPLFGIFCPQTLDETAQIWG